MRIVILDANTVNPGDLSWEALAPLGDLQIYERTSEDDIVERCKGAEIVLTNKVILDPTTLNMLPRLQYIGVLATGYNVVDLDVASRQRIVVTNVPAYSTESVAQTVFAHILNIVCRTDHYARANRTGRWTNSPDFMYLDHNLFELQGKRIGIVGLGNTGMATARIALAFGMKVQAYTSKNEDELPVGIRKVNLDELFMTSDIISLHCPLTDTTHQLICRKTLILMKPSAILINTSRGPLVNENDLAVALNDGIIAAYGTDVLSTEPPAADNPLLTAPNCYITPHIAWASREARSRLIAVAIQNVQAFINGIPQNQVNTIITQEN